MPRIKKLVFQNVTEGTMTPALKGAAIVFLTEASLRRVKKGRGRRGNGFYRSFRLPKNVISWDKSEFKVVRKGIRIFHNSGKAEKWDGVPTPSRGVQFIMGYWEDDPKKEIYLYWHTHLLNSWNPFRSGVDRWTKLRRWIVTKLSIPVIEDLVERKMAQGRIVGGTGGGDTNSIPWGGRLKGMTSVYNKGLDRVWKFGKIEVFFVGRTPKTGVGNQMKHEGVLVHQNV